MQKPADDSPLHACNRWKYNEFRMIRSAAESINPNPPAVFCQARTVLVVEAPGALRLLDASPARQGVVMTRLDMLNARMLAQIAPDAVIGPLIAGTWDSLDLATVLEDLGYGGTLFILTRPLPRAELVLRELRACCPTLTIALLETV